MLLKDILAFDSVAKVIVTEVDAANVGRDAVGVTLTGSKPNQTPGSTPMNGFMLSSLRPRTTVFTSCGAVVSVFAMVAVRARRRVVVSVRGVCQLDFEAQRRFSGAIVASGCPLQLWDSGRVAVGGLLRCPANPRSRCLWRMRYSLDASRITYSMLWGLLRPCWLFLELGKKALWGSGWWW